MSPVRKGFNRAGSSGVERLEEVKGSGSVGGDEEVKIDLNDELGSLLDFLNAWRRLSWGSP